MPDPGYSTDQQRLHQFDTALAGARAAFDRINDDSFDGQLTLIEILYWLGAAIEAMQLKTNPLSIYTAVYWVRNLATHDMWNLFALTPAAGDGVDRHAQHRYNDWYFEAITEGGGSYDADSKKSPGQVAYVLQLEGKSVKMQLGACLLELATLRNSNAPP
jgi:hypothetical protein